MSSSPSTDRVVALRTLVTRAVREATGLNERLALPIAEDIVHGLRRQWGGQDIRIPAQTAAERAEAIQQAAALGMSPQQIAAALGHGKATVYRALANHFPQ
jgi:DNA-binding NarL/FixJ family response regulator